MYNEFATYTKDDDMLLMEEDNYPADNVEMRDDIEKVDDSFVLLKKLMEIDTSETTDDAIPICNHSIAEISTMEPKQKVVKKPKSRGSYRRFTCGLMEKLFDLIIEKGKTAKQAALVTGINIRITQHYLKKYNDDDKRRLSCRCRMSRVANMGKLTEGYTKFLLNYIDMHPTSVLADIRDKGLRFIPRLAYVSIDIA